MTEKEQQLLKNIMLWSHEKSRELAMLLVKGIQLCLLTSLILTMRSSFGWKGFNNF